MADTRRHRRGVVARPCCLLALPAAVPCLALCMSPRGVRDGEYVNTYRVYRYPGDIRIPPNLPP